MGSLLTKTTPPGRQESQPTPDQPTKDEKETRDVMSSETVTGDIIDPTETVASETGDVAGQGDTGIADTTEAASSATTKVVNETDTDTLPKPSEETAPETHVTEPPDVATKVTNERVSTNESPGVTADVCHDSPTQILESSADAAASHVEHGAECTSSDAEKLTNPEPESENSPSTVDETTEPNSSSVDVTQNNEDDQPEHQHQVTEHDNYPDEQHSTADVEQRLEEVNLAPNDSLVEI